MYFHILALQNDLQTFFGKKKKSLGRHGDNAPPPLKKNLNVRRRKISTKYPPNTTQPATPGCLHNSEYSPDKPYSIINNWGISSGKTYHHFRKIYHYYLLFSQKAIKIMIHIISWCKKALVWIIQFSIKLLFIQRKVYNELKMRKILPHYRFTI